MSKALSYKDAERLIKACQMTGSQMPTVKYLMRKREPESWDAINEAVESLMTEAQWFSDCIQEDVQRWG